MRFDRCRATPPQKPLLSLHVLILSAFLVLAAAWPRPAAAQSDAHKFFEGKQITLLMGSAVGTGYDLYGRLVVRHMEKHMPKGATFVVKNMPGASGVVMSNFLLNVAPPDGLTIGLTQREAIFEPIFTPAASQAKYDPRDMTWIGTPNQEFGMFYVSTASGISTFDDLKKKPVPMGAAGGGAAQTIVIPKMINAMTGSQFKMITGYPGSLEIIAALEKGEVDSRFATGWAGVEPAKVNELIAAGKARLLMTFSKERQASVGSIPTIMESVGDPENRAVLEVLLAPQTFGRPIFASPKVPTDRLKILRDAFDAAMKDPAFIGEADKAKFILDPLPGVALMAKLKEVYDLPPAILSKTVSMMDAAAAAP